MQFEEQLQSPDYKRLIEDNRHPFLRLSKMKNTLGAAVAVVAKDQRVRAELHQFRLVCAPIIVWRVPLLHIDRSDGAIDSFEHIYASDETKAVRSRKERTGLSQLIGVFSHGSTAAFDVDRTMLPRAFGRVGLPTNWPCTHSRWNRRGQ